MNSKTFTLLFFLVAVIFLSWSVRALNSLTQENVVQAAESYVTSGHADANSQSFTNWSGNEPPLIPARCAKCHGTPGFLDYLGADSSTPGQVDQDAPAGVVITCIACHNPAAHKLTQINFHAGAQAIPRRSEAVCLACHQTLQSTTGILAALQGMEEDIPSPDLSFINPHYNFAASTQLGSSVMNGYQYPSLQYAGYFSHAAGAETCIDCHNPHSLEVEPARCAACHSNVVSREHFVHIRTQKQDFDGNADTKEGIAFEISSLHSKLWDAIQAYARTVTGKPVVYGDAFPYFFIDSNNNGIADNDELNRNNRFNAWTPRLLKAAYNYQFVKKDPGGYVHNPRYVIQLLQDSLNDLQRYSSKQELILPRP